MHQYYIVKFSETLKIKIDTLLKYLCPTNGGEINRKTYSSFTILLFKMPFQKNEEEYYNMFSRILPVPLNYCMNGVSRPHSNMGEDPPDTNK